MAYLGKTPSQAVRSRYYFTASGGETSLSGTDDNSNTLTFTDGNYVDVNLNGVTLVAGTDYNTTTANTIGGLTALVASDVVEVVVYDTFSVFSGNVSSDFSVGGNLTVTGSATFDTNTLYVDNVNNRVGIGTTSPSSGLHVLADVNPTLKLDRGSANTTNANLYYNGTLTGQLSAANADFQISAAGASTPMSFYANGSERMRINSSGDVGVGTSSPNNKFVVSDNGGYGFEFAPNNSSLNQILSYDRAASVYRDYKVSANQIIFGYGQAGANEAMRIDSSGNVGIGKSSYVGITTDGFWYESGSSKYLVLGTTGSSPLYLNRNGSDGGIVNFYKGGTNVGAVVYSSATNIAIGNTSKGIGIGTGSVFPTNGSTAISDAGLDLGYSSSRFKDLYLSGGAYLGGTGSANHLHDYEEGTFTPTVASTGTNPTVTYSKQEGNYTKIGNQVTVTGLIEFSAFTSNGGSLRLEGLPFNVATHTDYRAVGSVMVDSVATNLTGDYTNIQLAYNSGTSCQIFMNNSVTGGVAETPANNIDAGTKFRYQLSYITLA